MPYLQWRHFEKDYLVRIGSNCLKCSMIGQREPLRSRFRRLLLFNSMISLERMFAIKLMILLKKPKLSSCIANLDWIWLVAITVKSKSLSSCKGTETAALRLALNNRYPPYFNLNIGKLFVFWEIIWGNPQNYNHHHMGTLIIKLTRKNHNTVNLRGTLTVFTF